jgi:hypothetical protein
MRLVHGSSAFRSSIDKGIWFDKQHICGKTMGRAMLYAGSPPRKVVLINQQLFGLTIAKRAAVPHLHRRAKDARVLLPHCLHNRLPVLTCPLPGLPMPLDRSQPPRPQLTTPRAIAACTHVHLADPFTILRSSGRLNLPNKLLPELHSHWKTCDSPLEQTDVPLSGAVALCTLKPNVPPECGYQGLIGRQVLVNACFKCLAQRELRLRSVEVLQVRRAEHKCTTTSLCNGALKTKPAPFAACAWPR